MRHEGAVIGREREQSLLAEFVDARDSRALLLRGEAGMGKSVLLDRLARYAAQREHHVVRAIGVETESVLPFAGLHQVLHPLLPRAGELHDDHRALIETVFGQLSGTVPSVMTLGVAVLDLLALVASKAPLLIVIDDGHWFDAPSAEVLSFISRRLSGDTVGIVIGLREEMESPFDDVGLPEMELTALSEQAAGELLDAGFPGLSTEVRRAVLDTAGGNPLALVELPRSASGIVGDPAYRGMPNAQTIPLSRRLERMYRGRVEHLPSSERGELLRGALDGIETASAPRRVTADRYRMENVERALAQGLVTIDAETYEYAFRHPLVRSALVQMATPNERRAAHLALAELHHSDIERRARHLSAATVDPDEAVAVVLEEAAASATLRGGAATAVTWLTRAAELSQHSKERARRLAEAAFTASQAGLLDRAQRLSDEFVRDSQSAQAPAAVTSAYVMLYRTGDVRSAHRLVCAALDALPAEVSPETASRLVNVLLPASMFAADPVLWQRAEEAIDRFADHLDPLTLVHRDSWGDVARRGAGLAKRIEEAFARPTDPEPWEVMRLGVSAYFVDALGDFRSYLHRVVDREKDSGAFTNYMTLLQLVMLDQMSRGSWQAAEETGRRGLELTQSRGYELFAYQFHGFLGLLAAWRGECALARELQTATDAWARPRGIGNLTQYAEAIGTAAALSEGDYEAAYVYASGITEPGSFTPYSAQALRTLLDLVEAALHTGRTREARRHALAARDLGLPAVSPRLSLLTQGALAMTAEEDEDPGKLFDLAVGHAAAPSFPFEHARIELAQGMWLRRSRQTRAARQALAHAAATFDRIGARTWAERARAEIGATGAAGRVSAEAAFTLTAQERQIAGLAAGGMSNKEIGAQLFLSPRTVGSHLYRIFPKLGITSRAALRDALPQEETASE
ncbi:AAA family ATPase [Streptomyces sp. NBC_01136]|uniref:helix-turn-helix transcriptional regulator n=1 Tax=unclassified Streptomyces TaxID=2593676 RepID=UPI00324778B1|nr:AAA family ATPase [Streptomyces sp. NBC_01136]